MRERALTLSFALGALLLFYLMFVQPDLPSARGAERVRPRSTERRADGYLGARVWLERAGVRTRSLRAPYTELERVRGAPPSGNLLVTTLPGVAGFATRELVELDRWVRRGNTLLVLAALEDRPAWAPAGLAAPARELKRLVGLDIEPLGGLAPPPFAAPPAAWTVRLVPIPGASLLRAVRVATASSTAAPRRWRTSLPAEGFMFALAHSAASGQELLWERPAGDGAIIVSAVAGLFANRALGSDDNAQLLANLVGASLARDGIVIFDDFRQGVSARYDPAKFYRDPRLGVTAGILAALWLAWILGATRLPVLPRRAPVPGEAEFLQGAGAFLARVLRSDAGARRLIEHFAARLDERLGLPGATGVPWAWLERHPRVNADDLALLRRLEAAARAGRRVPLARLQQLLVRLEGRLS